MLAVQPSCTSSSLPTCVQVIRSAPGRCKRLGSYRISTTKLEELVGTAKNKHRLHKRDTTLLWSIRMLVRHGHSSPENGNRIRTPCYRSLAQRGEGVLVYTWLGASYSHSSQKGSYLCGGIGKLYTFETSRQQQTHSTGDTFGTCTI